MKNIGVAVVCWTVTLIFIDDFMHVNIYKSMLDPLTDYEATLYIIGMFIFSCLASATTYTEYKQNSKID
jgi:hypothetical protein